MIGTTADIRDRRYQQARLIACWRVMRRSFWFNFMSGAAAWPYLQRLQQEACKRSLEEGIHWREREVRDAEASILATVMLAVSTRWRASGL